MNELQTIIDALQAFIERETDQSNLFTYFSITASFLLIFPLLLTYHSHAIDFIDRVTEEWSSILIKKSRDIIRQERKNPNFKKSDIAKKARTVDYITIEFDKVRNILKPKQILNFYFGVFSVLLFFIILYKIYYYSYNSFPMDKFIKENEFGFFSWCWWASILFSIIIFLLRLYPLYILNKEENYSFFGKKRLLLVGICFFVLFCFWFKHFFYFAYPAISYFISTLLLMMLLLVENACTFLHLKGVLYFNEGRTRLKTLQTERGM